MSLAMFLFDDAAAYTYLIVKIVIACLMVVASGFIIFVVMKQSGNTDGTEALSGSGSKDREQDSFYGKNSSGRRDAKLKFWTYICAGALAVLAIGFLILTAIVG